jgi:ribosomal protein S18 acetylase RimI-like enzyme
VTAPAQPTLRLERVTEPTAEHVDALIRLMPQLSSTHPPDLAALARICRDERVVLLFARLDGELVGSLTLVLFEIATGRRALIEDVVVDGSRRGEGIGTALVGEALRLAGAAGARNVDLTSRPSREAANRLYERCGFARRETNVWRHDLG